MKPASGLQQGILPKVKFSLDRKGVNKASSLPLKPGWPHLVLMLNNGWNGVVWFPAGNHFINHAEMSCLIDEHRSETRSTITVHLRKPLEIQKDIQKVANIMRRPPTKITPEYTKAAAEIVAR
jgi:hypothetical protein